ncbi:RIP homotypic interaction motif-containing protein [Streptomyces lunaelactis]
MLLRELDAAGRHGGVNVMDIREAKGVQVGDHNTQTNTFN